MSRVFRNVVVIVFLGMTPAASQLPPEIQADRYLLAARQAIERQDFTAAQTALDKMSSLETEKGLKLPEEFYFRSAQVAQQTGRPARAVRMVTRYLEIVGRDGKQYIEALELLNAAEAQTFNAGQTCSGKAKGSECWKELANQPGCHVWDDDLVPDQTVTWTAECAESLAQGTGTLKWVSDGGKKTTESSGDSSPVSATAGGGSGIGMDMSMKGRMSREDGTASGSYSLQMTKVTCPAPGPTDPT